MSVPSQGPLSIGIPVGVTLQGLSEQAREAQGPAECQEQRFIEAPVGERLHAAIGTQTRNAPNCLPGIQLSVVRKDPAGDVAVRLPVRNNNLLI